ncbi:MAG: DUF459 domain-containing protein [Methylocystis sp.]|uniref:SGNH/GDSL hydrolase family protein n=1 Tax=Methylocystis sp. TaxID=1911079 RepID=UPI003D0C55DF
MLLRSWISRNCRKGISVQFKAICILSVVLGLNQIDPAQAREQDALIDKVAQRQSSQPQKIAVVGDSLAKELGHGMQRLLREADDHTVVTFAKPATGLMRDDVYDWQAALKQFLAKTKLDLIVVMIGGNDRQSIFVDGHRLSRGSPAWRAEYERRVARFMDALTTANAKVYWIGLPAVRSAKMTQDYRELNQVFRKQAEKHKFAYVSTWKDFVDEGGDYSSFGRSLNGVKRRLRKEDGMHFTLDGELLLAHVVAQAIGLNVNQVRIAR